jgi:hypothetical protein
MDLVIFGVLQKNYPARGNFGLSSLAICSITNSVYHCPNIVNIIKPQKVGFNILTKHERCAIMPLTL